MINISKKSVSYRRACVFGSIYVGKDVFNLIKMNKIEKGNPLILAEIAGINAAKNTSNLLLLCHQINLENIFLNIIMDKQNYLIKVYCIVCANAKTGVEMEAMCGVSIALLTIYDLTKKFNPFIYINKIKLLFKDGGENGLILGSINNLPSYLKKYFFDSNLLFDNISVFIITVSDRSVRGYYEDISGQILTDFFNIRNAKVISKIIIPDDINLFNNIIKKIIKIYLPNIILISGGTGLGKKDITNIVLSKLCYKKIPGISELLRFSGSFHSITSWLSSSFAGIFNDSLLISIPGNPSAVFESLNVLEELLLQSVKIIKSL